MPHAIIEHSNSLLTENLTQQQLNHKVFEACVASGLFQIKDIKSRVIGADVFQVGSASSNMEFIHVTLKIMPGRSQTQQHTLSTQVLTAIIGLVSDVGNITRTAISVEVVELNSDAYVKKQQS